MAEDRVERPDQVSGLVKSREGAARVDGVPGLWELIESEHAGILELLSRARVIAAQSRLSVPAILPTYEAVVRKFEEHFANEEQLMTQMRFPEADAHHRHHQVLLIRLLSICERMRTEQVVEIEQLQLIFQSLLDDAIGADESFREHLERGLDALSRQGLRSWSGLERD